MFEADLNANDLIHLGVNLSAVTHPNQYDSLGYHNHLRTLVERLEKAGFTNTLIVARPLFELADAIHERQDSFDFFSKKIAHFSSTGSAIDNALTGEGENTTLILTDAKPVAALEKLANLRGHQQALLSDLITCLKAHLARPAVVVAWALGYDIVRTWVFDNEDRRNAFNAQSRLDPVINYSDFFKIGERKFLEVCRDTQHEELRSFTNATFEDLSGLLRQRNEFAHANYAHATSEEAGVFVQRMVRILTGPPFDL